MRKARPQAASFTSRQSLKAYKIERVVHVNDHTAWGSWHMLFGVVMKRLTCCPGEVVSFHSFVESYSSVNP